MAEVDVAFVYPLEHRTKPNNSAEIVEGIPVCEEYAKAMEKLSFKLLENMALSLGLPEKRLNGYFDDEHTNSGALTVLAQDDVAGIEVKRKTDGEWIKVMPIAGSYIINVWSNHAYESAEHRVVMNSERERFSIPCFFNPSHTVMVKPLDELINDQNPAKYKEYNWGKFFKTRKISDFKKLDVENIQVHHFKESD
ncbi:hypothetical protein MKX03_014055 [Papaver bracteatum]|nr:hypothetical protein MKX03_014055 [Papaver bracteatum]